MNHGDKVTTAYGFASAAHRGQTDKAGRPYTGHLKRVVDRVWDRHPDALPGVDFNDSLAVAWLHDVMEDTDVTQDLLAAVGFPASVLNAVDALTHRPHESRLDYYARVRANALALVVKRADVEDNADPDRLALLDEATRERLTAKYTQARDELAWYEGGTR